MNPQLAVTNPGGKQLSVSTWRASASILLTFAAVTFTACGGGGASGTEGIYKHPEEGTIVLEDDGSGSITQSADPVLFSWTQDGDQIDMTFEDKDLVAPSVTASLDGDQLTFAAGQFSGDEPVMFTRQP